MREVHITVTWQSDHVVELEDGADLAEVVQVLAGQSNARLVGYEALTLDEAVDAAVEKLLGQGGSPAE